MNHGETYLCDAISILAVASLGGLSAVAFLAFIVCTIKDRRNSKGIVYEDLFKRRD